MFNSQFTCAALLDVASAYDNVATDILVTKLIDKRCSSKICNIIGDWTMEREAQFVKGDGQLCIRKISKGLPQGAVLSQTLYDISTEDVGNNLNNIARIQQFADDIILYARGDNIETLKEQIITAIGLIEDTLSNKGLQLQTDKT